MEGRHQAERQPIGPEELVAGVLEECRTSASAGARLLWRYAAEKLRRSVGDRDHLERLLDNELFGPLVGFERCELGPLQLIEGSARQQVTVWHGRLEEAHYLFSLRRTGAGGDGGSWLISGIEREL